MRNAQSVVCLAGLVATVVWGCAPPAPAAPTSAPAPTAAPAAKAAPPAAAPAPSAQPAAPVAKPQASPSPASAAPTTMVKVPEAHQGFMNDSPVYLALERGYFREEGLDVELSQFNSGADQIPGLSSGQLFVGVGAVNAGLVNSIVRGIPLRVVADKAYAPPDYRGLGWLVRNDLLESGRVKEPKDLKGLTIGRGAVGTGSSGELDVLLGQGGLTEQDVNIREIDYANMPAAFASKALDVGFAIDPFSTNMEEQKLATMWKTTGQIIPNRESAVYLFSPVFIERHPDLARRWAVAYIRGVRDYIKGYENGKPSQDIIDVMVKYGREKDPARVANIPFTPINPDGHAFRDSIQADLQYFRKVNLVTEPIDASRLVDNSFVEYAISRLGTYKP